ncbi:MAG TPA: hypothetical protein VMR16_00440 [Candidatus Saccharimonadales bacterium]|nr:hypothetical protein [Candidatus Saccharimonadales bacterium]
MKKIIKESLKQLVADRYLLALSSLIVLLVIIFSVILALSIQPAELQLVSHYSAFGITNFYKDQWFYRYAFIIFEVVVGFLHIVISIKLLRVKGRPLAILLLWFGVVIIIIGFITALRIFSLPL